MASEVSSEIYRQRWSVCDHCGCAITVTNEDGVPDPGDDETLWDESYDCPVCGKGLSDQYGNANPEIDREVFRSSALKYRRLAEVAEAKVAAVQAVLDQASPMGPNYTAIRAALAD